MQQELKQEETGNGTGKRVFGVVLRGHPQDFQAWLESARAYGLYVIFSKSTRTGKLILKEEVW